jgi:UDP-N-acetyl-D-mannosaminuronic acid dehydrogenase
MKHVCVVGLGYIGLPTATLAAVSGFRVTGVDIDPSILESLREGRAHFSEPELDSVLSEALGKGMMTFRSTPCPADVFIIAVPTPITEGKSADLAAVSDAALSIEEHIRRGSLVIVESTVPPTTTEGLILSLLERPDRVGGRDFYLAYCPERVLPGNIMTELVHNDRVVGGLNRESAEAAQAFYRRFVKGNVYLTNLRTAEMVKVAENAYRDVNIAFANELWLVADKLGLSVWDVINLANKHPRVNVLQPGPGVGGHCIAVDPWFLIERAPEVTEVTTAARKLNDSMPDRVASKVASAVPPGSNVACLGATYKANVGDTRESPALRVIHKLEQGGYKVHVVDPHVTQSIGFSLQPLDKALEVADCVVLLVDHKEFRELDAGDLRRRFGDGRMIDTRGIWAETQV